LKGIRFERLLVREFRVRGFFATRIPVSGRTYSGLRYPDVIAIKNGQVFLIECKMLSDTRNLYIDIDRYNELRQIQEITKVNVLIAIYYSDIAEFIFLTLDSVQRITPKYAVWEREYIIKHGLRIDDLVKCAIRL